MNHRLLSLLLIVWLLSPFLILVARSQSLSGIDVVEFWWALKNSFWQALGSALLSLFLGIGGMGLVFWSQRKLGNKWRSALEFFLLLPSLLPPLFILLALLRILQPFPYGLVGIILVHGAMNAGLCAVALSRLLETSSQRIMDQCLIEGCSQWRFLKESLFGYLRASTLALGLLVFSMAFTSFAVPLIVAGDQGTTLEVLIYEKIRIEGNLSSAISLALIQSLFIFLLSLILWRRTLPRSSAPMTNPLVSGLWGGLPVLGISLVILGSSVLGWLGGWERLEQLPRIKEALPAAMAGSLLVGLAAGLLSYLCLQLILFLSPAKGLQRFLLGYIAPSSVLAAFAYLLVTPNTASMSYLRLIFVLALLMIPSIYRLGWHHLLEDLRGQLIAAESLGASRWQRFWFVSFPQASATAGWLSGIIGFWAVGDFAVSRILVGGEATLALIVDSLMTFYRLDLAMSLSFILLLIGALVMGIFGGLGHVGRRKSAL